MAWTRKVPSCLIPEVDGHVPQKLPSILCLFKEKGSGILASIYDSKYRTSPILKGGLQTVLDVTFLLRIINCDTWQVSLTNQGKL